MTPLPPLPDSILIRQVDSPADRLSCLRMTFLFVSPDMPHADTGLRLVGTAVRAQAFSDPPVLYGIFGIHAGNRLARIAQRRLAPFLTVASVTKTQATAKRLG